MFSTLAMWCDRSLYLVPKRVHHPKKEPHTQQVAARIHPVPCGDTRRASPFLGVVSRVSSLPGLWQLPHLALYGQQGARPCEAEECPRGADPTLRWLAMAPARRGCGRSGARVPSSTRSQLLLFRVQFPGRVVLLSGI